MLSFRATSTSTLKDRTGMTMRRASLICILLAAAAIIAAEAPRSAPVQPDEPVPVQPTPTDPVPPAEPPPADATPPAERAATPPPAPGPAPAPLPTLPQPEFVSPRQPVYGPILPVQPAQQIAMQE